MSGRFDIDAFDAAAERERLASQPLGSIYRTQTDQEILQDVILPGQTVRSLRMASTVIEIETETPDLSPGDMRELLDYVLVRRGREYRLGSISTYGEAFEEYGQESIRHGFRLFFRAAST